MVSVARLEEKPIDFWFSPFRANYSAASSLLSPRTRDLCQCSLNFYYRTSPSSSDVLDS
ncbi:hypothetical protein HanRHA438_Chr06g0280441 [Helianthus annuus]|nr:hypothetical protein HanIR_Chr06g0291441 [Helianthus annuus]KAJ0912987.1 hypothetical protein HanRHA438_Chr06g0280441 [Helianthus annuus]